MSGTRYAQFCALARAAEILGERWTLLIIRELLLGPKRFGDLAGRLDGVSPTMLTSRLNALVESGVVQRATLPPPFNAQVYELTPVGQALRPAMRDLIRWGGHFLFPMREDDEFEPDWALLALDAIAGRARTPARRLALRIRHKTRTASFVVRGGDGGTTISSGEAPGATVIETGFDTLLRVLSGKLPLDRAVADGLARVDGSLTSARSLPRMFDLARGKRRDS
ncbi:MAG: winged helix-turn-helix transcriptional regulator [Gammaproteobacteria bacterium]